MKQLVEKTYTLSDRFSKQFSADDRMLDLVEEVGELAQALLIFSGRKLTNDPTKQRTKEDVADALADIMYDVILIARDYEVDLEKEYISMLVRLEERLESGEFDQKKEGSADAR